MKTRHSLQLALILSITWILSSCNSTKNIDTQTHLTLPSSFGQTKDTSSIAQLSWKDFFNDPSLIALIDTALKNNLDLKITQQQVEIAHANLKQAKGSLIPSLGLNVNSGKNKSGQYTPTWAGNNGTVIYNNQTIPNIVANYNFGLQSSWELDTWGRLRNQKKAAAANYLSSNEGHHFATTNLVASIATNYYQLLSLDKQLSIIDNSIMLQDSALTIVLIQKQAGRANILGVKQFEAQILNSKKLRIETLQSIEQCENNLNLLLGRFPQPIRRQENAFKADTTQLLNHGIPSYLLENRPDIRQAEFEVIAANANLKSAKASFLPTLNITGSIGYEAFNPSLITLPESLAFNLLGGLTAPLLNHNAIRTAFSTSKAYQIEALCHYEKTILNGFTEVRNQLSGLKYNTEILNLKSQEVTLLNQSISSSIELFKTGRANYLEILTMQENLLQANIELTIAQQNRFNTIIGLYQALGGGWR